MVRQITVQDLKHLMDAGETIHLLDVRNENEYQYCHLQLSQWIPLPELPLRLDEIQAERQTQVIVYCHHGIRSLSGAAILQNAGFQNVASLHGGIDAWSIFIDPSIPRY